MLRTLPPAVSLCALLLTGAPAFAIDEDPCSDVACDEEGCTACWEKSDGTIECDEFLQAEIDILCPAGVWPQGLHLTTPQGAREPVLLNLGRGQTLPQTSQPQAPQLQRAPTLPQ